jgi:hypothetical protein
MVFRPFVSSVVSGIVTGVVLAMTVPLQRASAASTCSCTNELVGNYQCAASAEECVPGGYICHIQCDS